MGIPKPLRRTCRAFVDGEYYRGGVSNYILHPDFAQNPQQYIRAFDVLQKDIIELFDYIEPADINNPTYSYRIHALLMRVCIEIEANFQAIFAENAPSIKTHLTMDDYKKLNVSHHLSSYEVKLPVWNGTSNLRVPFAEWKMSGSLPWYRAYNESKHDRQVAFQNASFSNLIDAICGLVAVLSAQFCNEDFSPHPQHLSVSNKLKDGFETAIGGYFRVKFPNDWAHADAYEFYWPNLNTQPNPIDKLTI